MKIVVRGKILRIIQDLYTENVVNVLVDSSLTKDFKIHPVVIQGNKIVPQLFLVITNDLLTDL